MSDYTSLKSLKTKKTKTKKTKGFNFWMILFVFLLIVIVILLINKGNVQNIITDKNKANTINAEEAGVELKDFINEVYSRGIKNIEITNSEEKSGLYAITALVTNQSDKTATSTLYITKDGKLFLPDAINIEEKRAEIAKQATNNQQQPTVDTPKTDKPKVELFTMSYCPFGNQAEDGISPVARLLANSVEIEPHYVIYSNYKGGGPELCLDKDDKYCSMHGIDELKQNVREMCIYKYNKSKFWDYIDAVNKDCNLKNINDCWDDSAEKLGINISKISSCLDSEAEALLEKEVELNKKYSIKGSPALVINGIQYQGGRAPENYKTAICKAFNTQPKECEQKLGEVSANASGSCN
ncbi:MAG: thioredoxin domain-containing protein [Patescibacteria group bacterium]|nr:thioredoxin domain-containing protein [Patescibacteria group bacterium]